MVCGTAFLVGNILLYLSGGIWMINVMRRSYLCLEGYWNRLRLVHNMTINFISSQGSHVNFLYIYTTLFFGALSSEGHADQQINIIDWPLYDITAVQMPAILPTRHRRKTWSSRRCSNLKNSHSCVGISKYFAKLQPRLELASGRWQLLQYTYSNYLRTFWSSPSQARTMIDMI